MTKRTNGRNTRKPLTAAEILAADDVSIAPVDVPQWGGTVYVRTISAGQIMEYNKAVSDGTANPLVFLVIAGACDAEGNRLFTADDVAALEKKNSAAIDKIATAVMDINQSGDAEGQKKS